MKANNILETIGSTPLVKINRLFPSHLQVWVKMEKANPGGSIKDRIALAMIEDAEEKGLLSPESVIIEPTSGNTGVGLAMVAAVKGYKLILVMPESMSIERRRLMSLYGAQLELTPREKGMPGAISRARELSVELKNTWMPMQFDNEANVQVHYEKTAREILKDFPEGFDYIITGVGTGGHITGVAKRLKEHFPATKSFAVEPLRSPILSGGEPGPHLIQGIGAGFIPNILQRELLDGVIQVDNDEAFEYTQLAAKKEGIFMGISSGASLAAIAKKLPDIKPEAKVLTFCYDTGERYLSIEGLFV
ncbi:MAG: cysteine synthase A [Candidatus Cyclobacteriaceae bacterium M3_2C_046]